MTGSGFVVPGLHPGSNYLNILIHLSIRLKSSTILLELPILIVKGTHLTRFQPSGNAMEVEGVLQRIAKTTVSRAIWTILEFVVI